MLPLLLLLLHYWHLRQKPRAKKLHDFLGQVVFYAASGLLSNEHPAKNYEVTGRRDSVKVGEPKSVQACH
jgi:hypothetical protein